MASLRGWGTVSMMQATSTNGAPASENSMRPSSTSSCGMIAMTNRTTSSCDMAYPLAKVWLLNSVEAAAPTVLDDTHRPLHQGPGLPEVGRDHECPHTGDVPATRVVARDEALVLQVGEDLLLR